MIYTSVQEELDVTNEASVKNSGLPLAALQDLLNHHVLARLLAMSRVMLPLFSWSGCCHARRHGGAGETVAAGMRTQFPTHLSAASDAVRFH